MSSEENVSVLMYLCHGTKHNWTEKQSHKIYIFTHNMSIRPKLKCWASNSRKKMRRPKSVKAVPHHY